MFHIVRDRHASNYTCISNEMLMDKRLNLSTRAFLAIVLALPDNWDFSVNGMAKFVAVNKDTVLRYIRELEELGYVRIESMNETGRFSRKSYTFYENTAPENAVTEKSVTENAAAEKAIAEKSVTENAAAEKAVTENAAAEKAVAENAASEIAITENAAAENIVTENAAAEIAVTENTVAENAAAEIAVAENAVAENTPQSNTNISNNNTSNNNKQNTISINHEDGQTDFSFLEKQINADALRAEYGADYINGLIEIIKNCMKSKSRTISGESVDNAELQRVFGMVCEDDIRKAVSSVKGKQFGNFAGYFSSVLFNQIKSRPYKPQIQPDSNDYSSIDVDEVMRRIMEKYRV